MYLPIDVLNIILEHVTNLNKLEHHELFIECIIEINACCSGFTQDKYSFKTTGSPSGHCTCIWEIRKYNHCLCKEPECNVMDLQMYYKNIKDSKYLFKKGLRLLSGRGDFAQCVNTREINSWITLKPLIT
jgi:hypothetical protein